jgi:hypothetical protein
VKQCPEVLRARNPPLMRMARVMSRPTPIVLILVGIGLVLFVLRIFGIGWLQYGWVLALSICLVAFGLFLYVIVKRPNQN